MPPSNPTSRADIAAAAGTAGQILPLSGPGTFGTPTKDVSALTAIPAGGSTPIDLATLNGYAKNARAHGATGDGTTDDYAACTAAITAAGVGGSVYIPPGTYRLSQPLLPLTDQILYGEGWGKSILKLNAAVSAPVEFNGVSRAMVMNLALDGNGQGLSGSARFVNSIECWVVNCKMTGSVWGVFNYMSDRSQIINNLITSGGIGHGIECNGGNFANIEGNVIVGGPTNSNGIEIWQVASNPLKGTRVVNNDIRSPAAAGIQTAGDERTIISNNRIHDCFGHGIVCDHGGEDATVPSRYGTISGNAIVDNGTGGGAHGISFTGALTYGWTATGNVVTGNASRGIDINSAVNCTLTGNVVSRNPALGISINGGSGHLLTANIVQDNGAGTGQPGIQVATSSNCSIIGNKSTNLVGTNQATGISLLSATNTLVIGNQVTGNATPIADSSGTNNRILHNPGDTTRFQIFGGEALIPNTGANGRAHLLMGGTTGGFPKIMNVGATLYAYKADDSGFADMATGAITVTGVMNVTGASGQIGINRRDNGAQAGAIYSGAGALQWFLGGLGGDAMTINANGAWSQAMDTMTYAATISLDVTKPNVHKTTTVNATGNATINASGAGVASQEITVIVVNDATSGKVITFGTNFRPTGTLTGTTSKVATVRFVSDGTAWYEVARTTGL